MSFQEKLKLTGEIQRGCPQLGPEIRIIHLRLFLLPRRPFPLSRTSSQQLQRRTHGKSSTFTCQEFLHAISKLIRLVGEVFQTRIDSWASRFEPLSSPPVGARDSRVYLGNRIANGFGYQKVVINLADWHFVFVRKSSRKNGNARRRDGLSERLEQEVESGASIVLPRGCYTRQNHGVRRRDDPMAVLAAVDRSSRHLSRATY